MTRGGSPLLRRPDGIEVAVRVTPRAARDEIAGLVAVAGGTALAVRVRAVADQGKANRAVLAVLAEAFAVAPSRLSILRGATARLKTIRIEGADEALWQALARYAAAPGAAA